MCSETLIITQAHSNGLMPAIHRDEININIYEQIAFSRAAIDVDHLVMVCLAYIDHPLGPLCVMVVVAIRIELLEDLLSHHPLHLRLCHLSMKRIGDNQMNIIYPICCKQLEDYFENRLPDIRSNHGRQWKADIVERYRNPHPRL